MPDLTAPLICASLFVTVGWVIVHARRDYADAIRHTLTIFALVLGLLATAGVTAKLRGLMGVKRMTHRVEARSQIERTGPVRPPGTSGGGAGP